MRSRVSLRPKPLLERDPDGDLRESRTIDLYFGVFEADGNEMLMRRVREIAGIEGSVSWFAEILA